MLKQDPAAVYVQHYAHLNGGSGSDDLNRLMYTDVKTLLADGYMEKTDKATMAASLKPACRSSITGGRARVPIPSSYKSAGGKRSAY